MNLQQNIGERSSSSSALQLPVAIAMTLNSINEFIIRMALTQQLGEI